MDENQGNNAPGDSAASGFGAAENKRKFSALLFFVSFAVLVIIIFLVYFLVVRTSSTNKFSGAQLGGANAQCGDTLDNDGDGKIDAPLDPGCTDASDNDETDPIPQCSDGLDNDSDGLSDFPQDNGCTGATDTNETDAPIPLCMDGYDNDRDSYRDSLDLGCHTDGDAGNPSSYDPTDNDEYNPRPGMGTITLIHEDVPGAPDPVNAWTLELRTINPDTVIMTGTSGATQQIQPGNYFLNSVGPAGYEELRPICSNSTVAAYQVSLLDGENVTCTFKHKYTTQDEFWVDYQIISLFYDNRALMSRGGGPIRDIDLYVKNIGGAAAQAPSRVEVTLYGPCTQTTSNSVCKADPNTPVLQFSEETPALAAGAVHKHTFKFNPMRDGWYVITARIDVDNNVIEGPDDVPYIFGVETSHHWFEHGSNIIYNGPPPPDYQAENPEIIGRLYEGQVLGFSALLKNYGDGHGYVNSVPRFRLDIGNDGTYDITNTSNSVPTDDTYALAADRSEQETWENIWTAVRGEHSFEICADLGNADEDGDLLVPVGSRITETIETNNCTTKTFVVTGPTLTLVKEVSENVSGPLHDPSGATIADWTLKAAGRAKTLEGKSADPVVTNQEIPAGTYLLSEALAPDSSLDPTLAGEFVASYRCVAGDVVLSNTQSVTIVDDQNVVCTVTNTRSIGGSPSCELNVTPQSSVMACPVKATNTAITTAVFDIPSTMLGTATAELTRTMNGAVSTLYSGTVGSLPETLSSSITHNAQFKLVIKKSNGAELVSCNDEATISCTEENNPPVCSLTRTPASGVLTPGQSIILTWDDVKNNADTATFSASLDAAYESSARTGDKFGGNVAVIPPIGTTTYSLHYSNEDGVSQSCPVSVTVENETTSPKDCNETGIKNGIDDDNDGVIDEGCNTPPPPPPPEARCPYFRKYVRYGGDPDVTGSSVNDPYEVNLVKHFLHEYEGEDLASMGGYNGIYTAEMERAVRRFQEKYINQVLKPWELPVPRDERWWYKTTRILGNWLMDCPEDPKFLQDDISPLPAGWGYIYEYDYDGGSCNVTYPPSSGGAKVFGMLTPTNFYCADVKNYCNRDGTPKCVKPTYNELMNP